MIFHVLPAVTHKLALRAPISLPVRQGVLGQVVLPDETPSAVRTLIVSRSVSGLVLPQSAVLRESLSAKRTRERGLFGVTSVVGEQL